jgi:hypothetical protein
MLPAAVAGLFHFYAADGMLMREETVIFANKANQK